jgi:hypothetical protein
MKIGRIGMKKKIIKTKDAPVPIALILKELGQGVSYLYLVKGQ